MSLKMVKTPKFEELPRYVRVRRRTANFVEFDFAIADPSVYIELILPPRAFEEFCSNNRVIEMTEAQARQVDQDMRKWRYGEDFE